MSGASIAAEVNAAFAEVARDVGDGDFIITLSRPATQPVNPWDTPAASPTTYELAGMVQDYPRAMIDGTLIRAEDRRVMLTATSVVPTVADRLTIGGKAYAIVSIKEVAPAGVPLYYEAQARA